MQEYYLDGNDNKTKSSFYQDINSGIYNNVAIGKVYFDNREMLFKAVADKPKKPKKGTVKVVSKETET